MTTIRQDLYEKQLKSQALRNNEYYGIQSEYDKLYRRSTEQHNFYKLMDLILDERNIRLAFRNIKNNKGSYTAGTDKETLERWRKSPVEEYVTYVRKRLLNFKPEKVRRVEIPKDNGKFRPLGIPTIGDRLIQQCIKQVLDPICEAKFHPHSYGFRNNRSTHDALGRLYALINLSQLQYSVDIDIKGFFDNVNHGKLLKQLWSLGIRDKSLLSVIGKMLKAEIEGLGVPTKGVPQGGILSPLLSNIVLNELDWWINSQWDGMITRSKFPRTNGGNTKKYAGLRKSNLKEIYIVRYADDFKILCRKISHAKKINIAVKQWLKERLHLEVSEEKSTITDLRKGYTEFLGYKITMSKGKKKGQRPYVVKSHMSDKAKEKVYRKLKQKILDIQKCPNSDAVLKYNATVLGIQNYYKGATHVNLDMNYLHWKLGRVLYNRLGNIRKVGGSTTETYRKFYPNNYQVYSVANVAMYPVGDVRNKALMQYSQRRCNYTEEGRQLIHKKLDKMYDHHTIDYLSKNPVQGETVEFNDVRISRYIGQYGKCAVSHVPLEIGNMELHHITPRCQGGSDHYSNVAFVTMPVHKLVHSTNTETILKYLVMCQLDEKQLKKLNKFRKAVGNDPIVIT